MYIQEFDECDADPTSDSDDADSDRVDVEGDDDTSSVSHSSLPVAATQTFRPLPSTLTTSVTT